MVYSYTVLLACAIPLISVTLRFNKRIVWLYCRIPRNPKMACWKIHPCTAVMVTTALMQGEAVKRLDSQERVRVARIETRRSIGNARGTMLQITF